jgi:ribosome-dependent ATPase
LRRLLAYSRRESLELLRDPIRLGFAFFGTAFLMLVLSMGISTDVDNLSFAVLDHDKTPESRAYIRQMSGSRYFSQKHPVINYQDLSRRLKSASVWAVVEVPPDFGRDINKGVPTTVGAWVDGAMPFRAETISGYLKEVNTQFIGDLTTTQGKAQAQAPVTIATRYLYNQNFDSIYAMVPSTVALQLMLIPAILMALSIVREKELGTITNLFATPVTRLEFLLGKQLPYVAISMVNFLILFLMGVLLFNVPLKGSFSTLCLGALLYVTATTGIGMLISAFTKTQIAALFGTAILTIMPATQFSGMLVPVSSLVGAAKIMGEGFPMTYFLKISVGTFTKGLGFADLAQNLFILAIFIPILTLSSLAFMRKQEA